MIKETRGDAINVHTIEHRTDAMVRVCAPTIHQRDGEGVKNDKNNTRKWQQMISIVMDY